MNPIGKKVVNNINCCVRGCYSKGSKNPNLSFHGFPKTNERKVPVINDRGISELMDRRDAWILKLGIDKQIKLHMKVCSLHFEIEDYILPYAPSKRRSLKKYSVPSQKLPVNLISDSGPSNKPERSRKNIFISPRPRAVKSAKRNDSQNEDPLAKQRRRNNERHARWLSKQSQETLARYRAANAASQRRRRQLKKSKSDDTEEIPTRRKNNTNNTKTATNNATQEISTDVEQVYIKEEPIEVDPSDYSLYEELRDSIKKEFDSSECDPTNSETGRNSDIISIKEEPIVNVKQECSDSDNEISVNHEIVKTKQIPVFESVYVKEEPLEEELTL